MESHVGTQPRHRLRGSGCGHGLATRPTVGGAWPVSSELQAARTHFCLVGHICGCHLCCGGCPEWSVARWGWPGTPPGPMCAFLGSGAGPRWAQAGWAQGWRTCHPPPPWGGLENLH